MQITQPTLCSFVLPENHVPIGWRVSCLDEFTLVRLQGWENFLDETALVERLLLVQLLLRHRQIHRGRFAGTRRDARDVQNCSPVSPAESAGGTAVSIF